MKMWVDPAYGWKYGFPAIWNNEKETIKEMLDRHQYPEHLRSYAMWCWEVEKEDES